MGMAASQARFLGLTARQTNLQFEGQQINQQRTTLSNQSANCYNSLLAMTVPVPPSTDDYTKLVYTFTPTVSTSATIDQIFANPGNHTFNLFYTEYGSKEGVVDTNNRARIATIDDNDPAYEHNNNNHYLKITTQDMFNKYQGLILDNTYAEYTGDFVPGTTYYVQSFGKANGQELTALTSDSAQNFINSELEQSDYYQYELNGVKYYVKRSDVSRFLANQAPISVYTTGSVTVKEQKNDPAAIVEYDNQARVSSITIERNGVEEKYSVTTTTEVDEEAYNDAYNQYIYEQYLYDQKQTEINASIEIIQTEDKNLELRLKQLDTENNAIQNEIEAVSKVLKNNIESSFKTFNA